ncbi:MAG: hypothetical protein ABIJ15_09390 [bacterium]
MSEKKLIYSAFFIFYFSFFASIAVSKETVIGGGYPGEYLLLFSPSARSLSMGGVSATGAESLYFNPSGLSDVLSKEFVFMRAGLSSGGEFLSAFFAVPVGIRRAFSIGYVSCGIDGAEWVDDYGFGNRGTFGDERSAFFAGYAGPVARFINGGFSVKVVSQKIHTYEGIGYGLDAGMSFVKSKKIIPSVSFQNLIQPSIKLGKKGEDDKFPVNGRVSFVFKPFFNFNFIVDGVFENLSPEKGEKMCNFYEAGMEYRVNEIIKMRLGYNPTNITAGAGINLGRIDFDCAVLMRDEGELFTAGVVIRWGMMPNLWEKKLTDREDYLKDFSKNLEIEKKYVLDREKKTLDRIDEMIENRIDTAKRYIRYHEYEKASKEIETVLKIQPENEAAENIRRGIASGRLKADLSIAIARQYYKNGDYKKALKKAKKAIEQNREHPTAKFLERMIMARIFIDGGNYYQAKEHLLEAFKIFPDDSECITLLNGINGLLKAGGR